MLNLQFLQPENYLTRKVDFREIGSDDGRWMELAVDCVQWQALVWAVLSLWVLPGSWILSRMDLMEIGSEDWGCRG
jgi:hypothetical protein